MLLVANSTPMVLLLSRLNSLRVKRESRLLFPTPESPMSTTGGVGGAQGQCQPPPGTQPRRSHPGRRSEPRGAAAQGRGGSPRPPRLRPGSSRGAARGEQDQRPPLVPAAPRLPANTPRERSGGFLPSAGDGKAPGAPTFANRSRDLCGDGRPSDAGQDRVSCFQPKLQP